MGKATGETWVKKKKKRKQCSYKESKKSGRTGRRREKKKGIQQKKQLIHLTLYTHFPPVIVSSPPDFIMCSDVSAVSQGASLSSLVVASFSPNTSCPIGNSM